MLIDGATVDLEQENQRLQAELRVQTLISSPCRRFLRGG